MNDMAKAFENAPSLRITILEAENKALKEKLNEVSALLDRLLASPETSNPPSETL